MSPTAREDGDIVIDVVDNGIGLPKENRSRLLEPGYRDDAREGHGTGARDRRQDLWKTTGAASSCAARPSARPSTRGAWVRLRFAAEAGAQPADGEAACDDVACPDTGEHLSRMASSDILIVDDEADIRELVAGILQDEGYVTRTARDSDDAITSIRSRRPNLVFLDIWLQGSRLDGLQLLDIVKGEHPDLPVVMISGHGNIETAVAAIKQGAYDFIEKPFKADRLVLVADRALETSRLRREVKELKQLTPHAAALVGNSTAINQLRITIDKVSPTNSRVMIFGPSGSGKELVARMIHTLSARASGPFVVINAAAITPERMEIELFGVEQTEGTEGRKVGALEEAHGGTLFIDEIGDLPRETQNKILRVLVDQTFQRVGRQHQGLGRRAHRVLDVAQHRGGHRSWPLPREDLFHRLSVVPIRIPALAERRDDIALLIEHFMGQISQSTGLPKRKMGADALAVLQSHD